MSKLSLGPEDHGREISIQVGDRILLRLPENPTTGFRWTADIPEFLSLIRDTNEPGDAPGAAGYRVLEFVASALGRTDLSLACSQAWEPTVPPTERFSVTVAVAGSPDGSTDPRGS